MSCARNNDTREEENNDTHTGAREMLKITKLLKQNNYEYDGQQSSNWYDHKILAFNKPIRYTDWDGNWINDNHISVTIEYNQKFVRNQPEDKDDNDDMMIMIKKNRSINKCWNKLLMEISQTI